jgi:hypothetical protein
MTGFTRTLFVSFTTLALAPALVAEAGCEIFVDLNFGLASWKVSDNQKIDYQALASNLWKRRTWKGTWTGYVGSDVNWNDDIDSAKVSQQCVLKLYADPGFKGVQETLSPGNHPRVKNINTASSLHCDCSVQPPPPFLHSN